MALAVSQLAPPAQPAAGAPGAPGEECKACQGQHKAHTCGKAGGGTAGAVGAVGAMGAMGVVSQTVDLQRSAEMLERLTAYEVKGEGGVPAALYASDITFAMPLPEPDEALGEAAPTQTRSGVMDSLLRASLLRYSALIPGVNYPMVYLGGRNTFFCWHVEDNHLYATNYVVAGAPKVWYGVPLSHMGALEEAWKASLPKLFDAHPDICYYKTCMFSPQVLAASGVPVYRAVHEAGSFMITTPGAYHAGFNTGFNIAESTNFAFCDW